MNVTQTIIETDYKPAAYFDNIYRKSTGDYELSIDSGNITATLNRPHHPIDQDLLSNINADIRSIFDVRRVLTNRDYELGTDRVKQYDGDEILGSFVYGSVKFECRTEMTAWLTVTRADGTVINTKEAHDAENTRAQALVDKHISADETLSRMVRSFNASFAEVKVSLVRLYEVLDAVAAELGGEKAAIRILNSDGRITEKKRRNFGDLCCVKPIKQGRHVGRYKDPLRDVKSEELKEARKFARALIVAYAEYLDQR